MFNIHRWTSVTRVWFGSTFKFSEDADYFDLIQPLYKLLNLFENPVRCVHEFGFIRGLLVLLYRFVVLISYISFAYRAYWQLYCRSDVAKLITASGSIVLYTLCVVRISMLNMYDREICELRLFFKDRIYPEQSEWAHRIRAGLYRRWNWTIILFMPLTIVNQFIFMCTNWHNPEFHLQYQGVVVGPLVVRIILQFFSGYIAVSFIISSCAMHIILQLFQIEMHIMMQNFKQNIDAEQQQFRETINIRSAYNLFCKNLHVTIRRHANLLQMISSFAKIFSLFGLLVYYGTLILMTCICFFVMHHQFSSNTVSFVLFSICLMVDTLLFCQTVDNINDLNKNLGDIVYSIYWSAILKLANQGLPIENQRSLRRSILIVLQQCQQPLYLGCNEFGTLSMHRFGELIQNIYSLITFLSQFD
uniref:Uncharacterized protein n=1 Tax=Anopheles minimus TaxID=112268 RepID=A0A182W249_9DIPT